ncbi:AAA family ATPase, partial [Streptomyces violascens]|uniref:AAA family ATPase n=1 Tax=Streptomyces violascens TaxID=67381 RepID=UPI0036BA228E
MSCRTRRLALRAPAAHARREEHSRSGDETDEAGIVAGYPFVGREDVLAELKDALARAAAGRGGLVSLTGAAGAGKTRTAEEA